MKTLDKIFAIGLLVIFAISFIGGCEQPDFEGDGDLKRFTSEEELNAYVKYSAESGGYGFFGGTQLLSKGVGRDEAVTMEAAPAAESAEEYSTTNIQVEGVDEADIVKNDGKYIYTVSSGKIVIVDAFPAENADSHFSRGHNPRWPVWTETWKHRKRRTGYDNDERCRPINERKRGYRQSHARCQSSAGKALSTGNGI